jgi:glycosyltransferase involved in cell wall biosynthesis
MSPPDVSVVIPTYNRKDYLHQAISSCFKENKTIDVEVIVVDDGSTDGTQEYLRQLNVEEVKPIFKNHEGASAARNTGIDAASSRYTKFLDDDDCLISGALVQQLKEAHEIEQNDPMGIVYGDEWRYYGSPRNKSKHNYPEKRESECWIAYLLRVMLQTSVPLHQTRFLKEINGFDEDLPFSQERDLHLRLAIQGVQFHYRSTDVVLIRKSGDDRITSQNKYTGDKDHLWVNRRILNKLETADALNAGLRTQCARGIWALGRQAIRFGYPEKAREYFDFASELSENAACGSVTYRLLSGPFPPVALEKFLMGLKRFLTSYRQLLRENP